VLQSWRLIWGLAGRAWRGPFVANSLSTVSIRQIRASQFGSIARAYRAAPFFMCGVGTALVVFVESQLSQTASTIWLVGVYLSYGAMLLYQEHYFRTPNADLNPGKWIVQCAGIYWAINIIWVFFVPLFWHPENQIQNMFLLMILTCHIVTVTAISFRNFTIFFANSVPPIFALAAAGFSAGGPIFPVMGLLMVAFYTFLVFVARSAQFQNVDTFRVRFRNEELITDLAQAKQASDQARARTEQANLNVREREELFRALVENAYDTIMLTDEAGFIRYAAPSVRQFDIAPELAIGRRLSDVLRPVEEPGLLDNSLNQGDVSGSVKELTGEVTTPTGRDAWIEASITDLCDTEAVGGLVLNIRDITERKKADDEMRSHLDVLNALARGIEITEILAKITTSTDERARSGRSIIFLVDEDLRVTDAVGPAVDKRLRDDMIGVTFNPTDGCCGAAIARGERVIVSDIQTDPLEKDYREILREVGYAACWSQPIFSRQGRILGTLATFYGEQRSPSEAEIVSIDGAAHLAGIAVDRRQQERQLRDASESAEMANRAKSRFLATMSHELRTPLNAIIGFSEVMQQQMFGPLGNDRYAEYTGDILTSGRHLLSMIDDILDISKIEAGRYDLEERDIEVDDVIRWSAELIRPKLAEGELELELEIPEDLPLVYADKRALRQVLLNLLSNAVKFTKAGGTITVTAKVQDNVGLTVFVTDTGIGIPADRVRETLEPFVQVESSMTGKHHGTGLGLSITKHLVEMHDGSFGLTSEEGVGTRVSFTFPPHRLILATDRMLIDQQVIDKA
jgi:PAS domain S-box-containing protein